MNLKKLIEKNLVAYVENDLVRSDIAENICKDLNLPVPNGKELSLFDGHTNKPKLSEDEAHLSVDVYIVDEDNLLGSAFYDFKQDKWMFHTDTLVDYFEDGSETKFWWFYPPFEMPYINNENDV